MVGTRDRGEKLIGGCGLSPATVNLRLTVVRGAEDPQLHIRHPPHIGTPLLKKIPLTSFTVPTIGPPRKSDEANLMRRRKVKQHVVFFGQGYFLPETERLVSRSEFFHWIGHQRVCHGLSGIRVAKESNHAKISIPLERPSPALGSGVPPDRDAKEIVRRMTNQPERPELDRSHETQLHAISPIASGCDAKRQKFTRPEVSPLFGGGVGKPVEEACQL